MERKVGEIFIYKGKTYKVLKATYGCKGCAFRGHVCSGINEIESCFASDRADTTSVIFKEIKNMEIENNQLTIDIPEGMEIDTKNSDLTKGIIKFKPKNFTYDDIEEALGLWKTRTGIPADISNVNKLCAINKLMNIAKYYNKNWKPNWSCVENKYSINYTVKNGYYINSYSTISKGAIYFQNGEDAQSVIDNPNFREILEVIYKY